MRPSIKHLTAGLVVGLTVSVAGTFPGQARADLNNAMGGMFDNVMYNTTSATTINTARRSGFALGSASARTRVMNLNVASFVPPSASAGCGGFDLTGGSFSFINADEFVEFGKTVVQNAAGALFRTALDQFMPSVAKVMESMQKTVTDFNRHFGNSCQMAEGLLVNTDSAFMEQYDHKANLRNIRETGADLFDSMSSASRGEASREDTSLTGDGLQGNLLWNAMREVNTESWFPGGDNELKEIILNVASTIIVGENVPAADGEGDSPNIQYIPAGNGLTLRDFIFTEGAGGDGEAGELTLYRCAAGDYIDCATMEVQTMTGVQGFQTRIEEVLFGTGGILERQASGAELEPAQETFINNMPGPTASVLYQFTRIDQSFARESLRLMTPAISVNLGYQFVEELLAAARASIARSEHPQKQKMQDRIEEAQYRIRREHDVLIREYGSIADLVDNYVTLLNAARQMDLVNPSGLVPRSSG